MDDLDSKIREWRSMADESEVMDAHDMEELEAHLRDQTADLKAAGLTTDEAFLIAMKRMGNVNELMREFAHEYSGRLWRQLFGADADEAGDSSGRWWEALVFASIAAVAIQVARLAASFPAEEPSWFYRNAGLFVLPALAAYLARRRDLSTRRWLVAAIPFSIAAIVVNVYPYSESSSTEMLVVAHLPVVLWFFCAYAYSGGDLRSHERRMDFIRFTGEWFIYYVLIALGGGVLLALTALILEPTGGATAERVIEWVLPSGAAGAVVIAAWLVETKQRVVENMAPVLTMLFTPLFALMLAGATVVYAATGLGSAFDRELLGVFDALLVVVLGLVLYGVSARDPDDAPGWMDKAQLAAVVGAIALDAVVLGTMIARIGELGFTPNRTAALGLNIVLLVSLVGTAVLLAKFLTGRGTFHRIERWQTNYIPVLGMWAAAVVIVLPPLFGFA